MSDDLDPPVPIGSAGVRFDRIDTETRAKVRIERNGRIRATLSIEPYRVPEGGADVVPIWRDESDD